LETFTELKKLLENPHFQKQKQEVLGELADDMIDKPIVNLIKGFNELPYCFTLQCCYGHFVYSGQKDTHNLDPMPTKEINTEVEYRIAYIAFCVENNPSGRGLLEAFKGIADIDPENIQYGCAEWFWNRQINSYTLQVEPDRFKNQDTAILDFKEALHIQKIRNTFFNQLNELLINLMLRERKSSF
jgi:hypothetical protein